MICIVRHGETDWNLLGRLQGKTDIPLNKTGIQQAEECRAYFNQSEWDIVVTSPLKRAKKTATIINEDLQLPIIEMEEFKERSFGDAEGLTLEERDAQYPDRNYPNMETRQEVLERAMIGLTKVNQQYPGKKVILVAHGAVIGAILSEISNGEIGSGKTKLINASLNHVEYVEEKWKIHNYNQIDHLTVHN